MTRPFVSLCGGVLLASSFWACGHAEDFNGTDRPTPSTLVGAACETSSDCAQYCARGRQFPQGFCTVHYCRGNDDCPNGTVCIINDSGVCVYPCGSSLDCAELLGRPNYVCLQATGHSTSRATEVRYKVCIGDD